MRPGVKIVALMPWLSNSSISRQMPTRPPNSPLASCIGGSLSSRRSSMASKSAVKLTAMRTPSGQAIRSIELVARVEVGGLGLQRGDVAIESVGDFGRGVHGQRPPATASVVPVM